MKKMKKIEEVAKELIGKHIDETIEVFGNYQFEEVSEIIIDDYFQDDYDYIAYANHKKAPELFIKCTDESIIYKVDIEYKD